VLRGTQDQTHFLKLLARRGHSPAALQFQGIGTPRWQLNETLIPGNGICYDYVNLVGLCAAQRKSGGSRRRTAGEIDRRAISLLIGAESQALSATAIVRRSASAGRLYRGVGGPETAVLNLFLASWLREVVSAARTVKNFCCCKKYPCFAKASRNPHEDVFRQWPCRWMLDLSRSHDLPIALIDFLAPQYPRNIFPQ
jgi:hypothetical protein